MLVTLCVDALEPQLGGIGRYTWELCAGLPKHFPASNLRYFGRNRLIPDPARLLSGEPLSSGRGLARRYRASQARRALRSSLVHGPNYFLPTAAESGIITVHDLSVFLYPETHPAQRVEAFDRLFSASIERASHIITDTETVRREILQKFCVAPEAVTAIHLGVDANFRARAEEDLAPVLNQWGLKYGGYGLCVSALEPRKKVSELIRAWRRLPTNLRHDFPLVLAGNSGWRNDHLHNEIQNALAEGWLRHLGFVHEPLLPWLYAGAALFVYPSIYEGFGLPPLEAMASGVPIIVSGSSCLPEVCGDAARYIDPDDPEAFAAAIEESISDRQWRLEMRRRGLDRAQTFTWDRCITETVSIYNKVSS